MDGILHILGCVAIALEDRLINIHRVYLDIVVDSKIGIDQHSITKDSAKLLIGDDACRIAGYHHKRQS